MLEVMRALIDELVERYEGGQPYFTALDQRIRGDHNVHVALVMMARALFGYGPALVVSGSFGTQLIAELTSAPLLGFNSVWVPGGLRVGNEVRFVMHGHQVDVSELPGQLVFIDDSFFKGRTLDAIQAATRGRVIGAVVAYDGASAPRKDVFSLYRWRDRVAGGGQAEA